MRGLDLPEKQAQQILARLIPIVQLDDLSKPWESDEFSIGWGMFGASVTGVAAETQQFALENPAGSGKLMVLWNFWVSTVTAQIFNVSLTLDAATDLASIAVSSNRMTLDGRHPGAATAQRGLVAVTRAESDPAISIEGVRIRAPGDDDNHHFQLEAILAPNQGILMEGTTVNINSRAGYRWFELPQVLPVG